MKTKSGWKDFFRSHPLFDALTLVSLEKLFYLVELKIFARNQVVFREGDEVKGFYLVYQGEVALSKRLEGEIHEKLDLDKLRQMKKNDLYPGKCPLCSH
jgi:signal-transduction protein with cAMP-binding, CBS, and nucleotidyltransferase domain